MAGARLDLYFATLFYDLVGIMPKAYTTLAFHIGHSNFKRATFAARFEGKVIGAVGVGNRPMSSLAQMVYLLPSFCYLSGSKSVSARPTQMR